MSSVPQLDRDELIVQFWNAVRERLMLHYHRKAEQADLGIGRYKWETERLGMGDTVYNQGVEQTADVVNGVLEYGMPTLTPQ